MGGRDDCWQPPEDILFRNIHTGSRANPATYSVDTADSFPRDKVEHNLLPRAEVQNKWSYVPCLPVHVWRE